MIRGSKTCRLGPYYKTLATEPPAVSLALVDNVVDDKSAY